VEGDGPVLPDLVRDLMAGAVPPEATTAAPPAGAR
jgi:hypothetical protein